MNVENLEQVKQIVEKMKANSESWWRVSTRDEQLALEKENQEYGKQLQELGFPAKYDSATGVWFVKIYDLFV